MLSLYKRTHLVLLSESFFVATHNSFVLQVNILRYMPVMLTDKLMHLYSVITKTRLFKYIENFTSQNWKLSGKKLWHFSYICLKHRLWVLVRTASGIMYTIQKWGLRGSKLHRYVFVMVLKAKRSIVSVCKYSKKSFKTIVWHNVVNIRMEKSTCPNCC